MNAKSSDQYGFGTVELLVMVLVLIAVVVTGALLYKHDHSTDSSSQTYKSVISKFVAAIGKGNSDEVISLESTQFKDWIENSTTAQKNTKGEQGAVITNNFYFLAKQDGALGLFNSQFLVGAKIETGNYENGLYVPAKNTTGVSETYDTEKKDYTAFAPQSFTIDAVRSGDTWLVDNVGYNVPTP